MRSSFWVVLGLVGAVPIGALAQEGQARPGQGAPASQAGSEASESGGQAPGQTNVPLNAHIFMGWMRAITGNRLLLEERGSHIYELGVEQRRRGTS